MLVELGVMELRFSWCCPELGQLDEISIDLAPVLLRSGGPGVEQFGGRRRSCSMVRRWSFVAAGFTAPQYTVRRP